jgi:hypothetical protein
MLQTRTHWWLTLFDTTIGNRLPGYLILPSVISRVRYIYSKSRDLENTRNGIKRMDWTKKNHKIIELYTHTKWLFLGSPHMHVWFSTTASFFCSDTLQNSILVSPILKISLILSRFLNYRIASWFMVAWDHELWHGLLLNFFMLQMSLQLTKKKSDRWFVGWFEPWVATPWTARLLCDSYY